MVYLAELLVVMTDRLKIVRLRARNVHHVQYMNISARQRRVSCVSLSFQGAKDKKLILGQCACLAVAYKQEIYIAYNFSHFAIYLSKLIKIRWTFDEVLTETHMHSFLRHGVLVRNGN